MVCLRLELQKRVSAMSSGLSRGDIFLALLFLIIAIVVILAIVFFKRPQIVFDQFLE